MPNHGRNLSQEQIDRLEAGEVIEMRTRTPDSTLKSGDEVDLINADNNHEFHPTNGIVFRVYFDKNRRLISYALCLKEK